MDNIGVVIFMFDVNYCIEKLICAGVQTQGDIDKILSNYCQKLVYISLFFEQEISEKEQTLLTILKRKFI